MVWTYGEIGICEMNKIVYIKFNNNIYRQKVRIPMGANYSPNIAKFILTIL